MRLRGLRLATQTRARCAFIARAGRRAVGRGRSDGDGNVVAPPREGRRATMATPRVSRRRREGRAPRGRAGPRWKAMVLQPRPRPRGQRIATRPRASHASAARAGRRAVGREHNGGDGATSAPPPLGRAHGQAAPCRESKTPRGRAGAPQRRRQRGRDAGMRPRRQQRTTRPRKSRVPTARVGRRTVGPRRNDGNATSEPCQCRKGRTSRGWVGARWMATRPRASRAATAGGGRRAIRPGRGGRRHDAAMAILHRQP